MARSPVAFTEVFPALEDFVPAPGSVYVYGTTPEDRSAHSDEWEGRASDVQFVRLSADTQWEATFSVAANDQTVSLRSYQALKAFWNQFAGRVAYIDMTGLGHHVWAPMLRAASATLSDVRVVYVEPVDYSRSSAPTESEIFDLSERIKGISPIPGFASIAALPGESFHLVALLGFEGTRLAYLLENVQPPGHEITPIVGAPGFRPEYPFYAYHGNKTALVDSRAWPEVRYVTANCPFSAFRTLTSVAEERDLPLKVAPIGTKPHSLGAVLYAMTSSGNVELVYDHPIRTAKRTVGASRALVYRVSPLLAANVVP